MNLSKHKKIGIALGGGGARGMAHIQFLKVFDELGIKPHMIAGTSMGALIGGLYAAGLSAQAIEDQFLKMNLMDMITLVDVEWQRKSGLIRGDKIIKTFNKLTKRKLFKELAIPLKVVVADYWDRSQVVLEKGDLSQAIRASISVPGLFDPVIMNNKVLIDGGVVNPVPYDLLFTDCDVVVAIDVLGVERPKKGIKTMPNIFKMILSAFYIMEATIVNQKLKVRPPDIYIKPKIKNVDILDFYKTRTIFKQSQEDVTRFKSRLFNLIKT